MKAQSFPSPVLNNGDDLAGHFKCKMKCEQKDDILVVTIEELEITNPTLRALIDRGSARFFVRAYSAQSIFRKTYSFEKVGDTFGIPVTRTRDRLELSPFVCATAEVASYSPEGLGADLSGLTFRVEPGEILAIEETIAFVIESVYNLAKPKSKSFVKIREGTHESGPYRCDYERSEIFIHLSKKDYKKYNHSKTQFSNVMHASIVLPVLVNALGLLQGKDASDYVDLGWATRIEHLKKQYMITDPRKHLIVAQQLLRDPFARASDDMESMIDRVEREAE